MNCFYHNENAAVGQCSSCNKGLCGRCSKKFNLIICTECNNRNWKSNHNQTLWGIFYFFLNFIVLSFFVGPPLFYILEQKIPLAPELLFALTIYLLLGWAASFRYYAQPSDNRITKYDVRKGEHAWIAELVGWIIKFMYYGLIGPVTLPLWISRTRRKFKAYKQYKRDIQRMNSYKTELV